MVGKRMKRLRPKKRKRAIQTSAVCAPPDASSADGRNEGPADVSDWVLDGVKRVLVVAIVLALVVGVGTYLFMWLYAPYAQRHGAF